MLVFVQIGPLACWPGGKNIHLTPDQRTYMHTVYHSIYYYNSAPYFSLWILVVAAAMFMHLLDFMLRNTRDFHFFIFCPGAMWKAGQDPSSFFAARLEHL